MISNIPQQGPTHPMMHRRGANGPETRPSAESTPAAGNAPAPGQGANTTLADATAHGHAPPATSHGTPAPHPPSRQSDPPVRPPCPGLAPVPFFRVWRSVASTPPTPATCLGLPHADWASARL